MIYPIFTNSRGISSFYFCFYSFRKDRSGARRTKSHGDERRNRRMRGGTGISSLPRKRKYRYLSGMYALVLRVTSAPFKYHQWLRELPLPLTVLAVRVRVGSRVERRDGNEMERVTEARSRKDEEGEEESSRVSHPIPLWVTKARNPPLVLPPRSC